MDIIAPTTKKYVILDATTLSSMMSCGRYYDLRFNHQLVAMKGRSNSIEVGSLIHKVLEVYYRHKIDGFPRTTAIGQAMIAGQLYVRGCPHCSGIVLTDVVPSCGHQPNEYPGLQNTPEQNEGWTVGWRFALDTCEQYFEHYKNDPHVPKKVEHVLSGVIYEDDDLKIGWKSKLDLLVDTMEYGNTPMDHKTFKQTRDKTTLSNQFMGQCVLTNSRNMIVNKIGLQTTKKIEERLSREWIPYSADRLDEWKNEIVPYYTYRFLEYAESEYWPPDYTHCDTMYGPCVFKGVCESNRNMREEVLRNDFQVGPKWDPTNREGDE